MIVLFDSFVEPRKGTPLAMILLSLQTLHEEGLSL